jgi:hypothetical protein
VADASPGKHDMLFPPCNRWLYEREELLDHPNCLDNFVAAAAAVGVSLPVVPDPVNVFQNSDPAPDGTLNVDTAASRSGDSASFRALRDVVVLTACAVDHWPTNGTRCASLVGRHRSTPEAGSGSIRAAEGRPKDRETSRRSVKDYHSATVFLFPFTCECSRSFLGIPVFKKVRTDSPLAMVRMGSPVRFRRGAPPQTSSSGRVQHPASCLPGAP